MTHDRRPGYFGDGPDGNDPLRPEMTKREVIKAAFSVTDAQLKKVNRELAELNAEETLTGSTDTLCNGKPIMEIVDDEPVQTLTQNIQRTPRDCAKVNDISIEEAKLMLKERDEANLMNLADKHGID